MENASKVLSLISKAATVVIALQDFWKVHGKEIKEIVNPVITYVKEIKGIEQTIKN